MKVSLLAAVAENGVIGRGGDLPWRLPADMRHVKRMTVGHCIVMGRKTFDSIGRPLPDRTSIVITRDPGWSHPGVVVVHDLESALSAARSRNEEEVFVLGGAEIYAMALPHADRLYLTRVHASVDGDVSFPDFDPADWECIFRDRHEADERHELAFSFEQWQRAGSR